MCSFEIKSCGMQFAYNQYRNGFDILELNLKRGGV
jgi:hypothetical protein